MKFLLFAGDVYYPSGGALDFKSSHSTQEGAVLAAARLGLGEFGWWQVAELSEDGRLSVVVQSDSGW